jgi:hypothetical protein
VRNGWVTAELNEFDAWTIDRNLRRTTPSYFGYRQLLITFNSSRYSAVAGRNGWNGNTPYKLYGGDCFKITCSRQRWLLGEESIETNTVKKEVLPQTLRPIPQKLRIRHALLLHFKYGSKVGEGCRSLYSCSTSTKFSTGTGTGPGQIRRAPRARFCNL